MRTTDALGYMATGFLLAAVLTVLAVGGAAVLGAPRAFLRLIAWVVPSALSVVLLVVAARDMGARL